MIRLSDYHALADLRYQVRRFLRVRELAARKIGVAPRHYQLLLELKGLEGRRPATIGVLAERLQLRHHSTVGLIDRLVARRLVRRRPDPSDRRQVVIQLQPRGEAVLRRLALHSLAELRTDGPALVAALARVLRTPRRARRPA
jgi:DNA-binding MarR family transcriptional regulator